MFFQAVLLRQTVAVAFLMPDVRYDMTAPVIALRLNFLKSCEFELRSGKFYYAYHGSCRKCFLLFLQ